MQWLGKLTGKNVPNLQMREVATLEEFDSNVLTGVLGGWLPDNVQRRAGCDFLILGGVGDRIKASNLGENRGGKRQKASSNERVLHLERYSKDRKLSECKVSRGYKILTINSCIRRSGRRW